MSENKFNIINSQRNLKYHVDGLVQDCSISSSLPVEILQSCTEPLMCNFAVFEVILKYEEGKIGPYPTTKCELYYMCEAII